jgi:hypothetical protein
MKRPAGGPGGLRTGTRVWGTGGTPPSKAPVRAASARGKLGTARTSPALPKFESYGMPETAAFRGWKAQDAIEWFHGIDRLALRGKQLAPSARADVALARISAVGS